MVTFAQGQFRCPIIIKDNAKITYVFDTAVNVLKTNEKATSSDFLFYSYGLTVL